MKRTPFVFFFLILLIASSCVGPANENQPVTALPALKTTANVPVTASAKKMPTQKPSQGCVPTHDDGVSPSYKPDAPIRNGVGKGHILTGVVRSSRGCAPIANVKLEFWPEEGDLGHPDSARATLFTSADGSYRFECNQPDHIHMRISAPGYRTIGVNSYHPEGKTAGTFDIVLLPLP